MFPLLIRLQGFVLWISFSFYQQGLSAGQSTYLEFAAPDTKICLARSINYIEPGLPSQCHKRSWPGATEVNPSELADRLLPSMTEAHNPTPMVADGTTSQPTTVAASQERGGMLSTGEETAPRTFISFEDWKDQRLREANADGLPDGPEQALGSAVDEVGGEEGLALRVEAVSGDINSIVAGATDPSPTQASDQDQHRDPVPYDEDLHYRSKDAGKTCKERFSYSSFDAGATVLKTNTGAKNPKAILVENKDSYMLLECAAKNKFVIVELTDDILIDTVVLANYEFFSSMIRQFRVSVSDRYPVKLDKWKILGTFEAKNSRDIQPFLVENPMIWAKYVRIEFLSHYGNEYYCPVSLLRVHGTRMLDSWKETESITEDDDQESIDPVDESQSPTTASDEHNNNNNTRGGGANDTGDSLTTHKNGTSTNPQLFALFELRMNPVDQSCTLNDTEAPSQLDSTPSISVTEYAPSAKSQPPAARSRNRRNIHEPAVGPGATLQSVTEPTKPSAHTGSAAAVTVTSPLSQVREVRPTTTSQTPSDSSKSAAGSAGSKAASTTTTVKPRNGTSTSASSPAVPSVQESFHKTVSKRLQLLETNVTLSLRYLEDQSRILQESQHLSERKQLAKVNFFLDNLNDTVLSELRHIRQQYDHIWQSTVMAIEGQKEQSQRELLALSSRLNLLADEVVFQKRMAIVQAVLLLSCLALVIFSRAASAQIPAIVHIPTTTKQPLQPRALESYRGLFQDQVPSTSIGVADVDVSRRVCLQSVDMQRDGQETGSLRGARWVPSTPPSQQGHTDDYGKISPDLTLPTNLPGFAWFRDSPGQVAESPAREEAGMKPEAEVASARNLVHDLSPPASPDGDGSHATFNSELLPRATPKPLPALPEDDHDE